MENEQFVTGRKYFWCPPRASLRSPRRYALVFVNREKDTNIFVTDEAVECLYLSQDPDVLVKVSIPEGSYFYDGKTIATTALPSLKTVLKPRREPQITSHNRLTHMVQDFGTHLPTRDWEKEEREYSELVRLLKQSME